MQAAPPLTVEVAKSRTWPWGVGTVGAMAGWVFGYWLGQKLTDTPMMGWVAGAALAVGSCLLAVALLPPATGVLRWDGQSWWWWPDAIAPNHDGPSWFAQLIHGRHTETGPVEGTLTVKIDWGRWLLTQFVSLGNESGRKRHQWLPLSQAQLGAEWHALRVTLFARSPRLPATGDDTQHP